MLGIKSGRQPQLDNAQTFDANAARCSFSALVITDQSRRSAIVQSSSAVGNPRSRDPPPRRCLAPAARSLCHTRDRVPHTHRIRRTSGLPVARTGWMTTERPVRKHRPRARSAPRGRPSESSATPTSRTTKSGSSGCVATFKKRQESDWSWARAHRDPAMLDIRNGPQPQLDTLSTARRLSACRPSRATTPRPRPGLPPGRQQARAGPSLKIRVRRAVP